MNSNQIMIASNVLGDSKESKQLSQKKKKRFLKIQDLNLYQTQRDKQRWKART